MEELYKLGLNELDLKCMIEINPDILNLTNEEVLEKILLLKYIKCSKREISNIISSNSLYLGRLSTDIIKLCNYLNKLGFKNLNILFDSNPYILNLEVFEIKEYIKNREQNGEIISNIIEDLESNTYLFNDML